MQVSPFDRSSPHRTGPLVLFPFIKMLVCFGDGLVGRHGLQYLRWPGRAFGMHQAPPHEVYRPKSAPPIISPRKSAHSIAVSHIEYAHSWVVGQKCTLNPINARQALLPSKRTCAAENATKRILCAVRAGCSLICFRTCAECRNPTWGYDARRESFGPLTPIWMSKRLILNDPWRVCEPNRKAQNEIRGVFPPKACMRRAQNAFRGATVFFSGICRVLGL